MPQVFAIAALILCCAASATAQTQEVGRLRTVNSMTLNQTRYRLRAGESTGIDAPRETLDFLLQAKTRRVDIAPKEVRGIVIGPNRAGDQILVAASLAMKPGQYSLTLSAATEAGERRSATLSITVDALTPVPSNATQPPVILLNGWQGGSCSPSPASETFGSLADYLVQNDGVPVVYWFDNCTVCPNCLIETLSSELAQAIGSIQYDNGTPVPQVDLIAHSMGGLVVRSYLSGKQMTSGTFDPPSNPNVRKAVFIATPHFGSYQAGIADFFVGGPQANEMTLGSQFLFDLATWNQFGDDLRGTDAIAIIGNAVLGSMGDGVVSLTSASLRFAEPDVRTRIVGYCHISFNVAEALFTGCYDPGIADIDSTSHYTYQIIQPFLVNDTAWQAIGAAPSHDQYLSANGGLLLANKTAGDQYLTDLSSIAATNANLNLTLGPSNSVASLFYNEWVPANTYDFAMWSGPNETLTGSITTGAGGGRAAFFKEGPLIFSVRSSVISSLPGLSVASGSNITISGTFGAAPYGVFAASTSLTVMSSGAEQIVAYLPASFSGLVPITVLTNTGQTSINIMATPAPVIAITPSSLKFSYTVSGTAPPAQSIQVANSGGGTLTWSASTTATWLALSVSAPSTLSVSILPSGLGAGTYTGSIQITAVGASNRAVSIPVSLSVAAATAMPPFTVALSTAGQIEPFAAQSIVSAYGTNLGTSPNSTTVTVTDSAGVARLAPLFYVSPVQVNFEIPAGTAIGSATVGIQNQNGTTQTATIQIGNVSPGLFTLNGSGLAAAWVLPVTSEQQPLQPVYQVVSGSVEPLLINLGPSTEETYLEMYGTGTRNAKNITAVVGGLAVPVLFWGAAPGFPGEDQVNIGPLPHTLSGQGNASIVVTADGQAANIVNVTIQ